MADMEKRRKIEPGVVGQDVPKVEQGEFVVLVNCNTGIVKGTVKVYGGTVQKVRGGTVQKVRDGGTVQEVWDGGTVQKVWGGTVQKQTGGIVIYADGRISVCNKSFYRLITPEEMK